MGNPNKLTPGSNLLWEGSRMMLPEHKLEIVSHRDEFKRWVKPELDEQEIEDIVQKIGESLEYKSEITLTIYGEYGNRQESGYVVRVDERRARVLLQATDGDEWIEFSGILSIESRI